MKKLACLTTFLLSGVLGQAAHANLIVNGGFELDDVATGSFELFPDGITGWYTTSGPGIEIQDNVRGAPIEGSQFVELDSEANSGMAQDVITSVGQQYALSFYYSARPTISDSSTGIDIYWNNVFQGTVAETGGATTNWLLQTRNLPGVTGVSQLRFEASGTSDTRGGYIDDVRLVAVPGPSSITLLGLALIGLSFSRRKRA